MQYDSSIMEMEIEHAKALLSFLQKEITPKIEEERTSLKPVSRVFYTKMGTLGFVSEAYYFRGEYRNLNISNPFQVILVPNQTASLYKAVHDMSSHDLNKVLNEWSYCDLQLSDDLASMAFKKEYIFCREMSGKHLERRSIPFVYIPELEISLWETMRKVDAFYFEKISERVPNYGQSAEEEVVIEGNASETGIVPFNETGGLVHLIGFKPNLPAK